MTTLPFILDSDIGSDVDDALALAFALRHPDLDLRAVTTVSGDTARRARIAKKLLLRAGRDDIEVAAGEHGRWTARTHARRRRRKTRCSSARRRTAVGAGRRDAPAGGVRGA